MKLAVAFLAFLAVTTTPSTAARAEPRRHDGLYLRFGAGSGYALGTLATTVDSDSHGPSIATEIAAGTIVRRGLAIGAGEFSMVVLAPHYDGISAGGQHVGAVGPFIDYYLRPGGGLHVESALLVTTGYLDGSDDRGGNVGVGFGVAAGVGFDRYVSAQWSLGLLARVAAYRLYGVDDSIRLASPSLLVTATYN